MNKIQQVNGVCVHCGRDYSQDKEGIPVRCADDCPSIVGDIQPQAKATTA